MTTDTVTLDATERVGKWEMRIARGDATPEAEERWNDRIDALTAWLLSEWEREQAERAQVTR